MFKKHIVILGLSLIFLAACAVSTEHKSASPYLGQETRNIKSLSSQDIEGLQIGHGTPFGGMAKIAELNGYPGPRHVLDLAEEMNLDTEQQKQIQAVYDEMNNKAIVLGEQIILIEQELNDKFENKSATGEYLQENVEKSAEIYGKLRYEHLKAHLAMMDILTSEQVQQYNELRGYTTEDPCKNIPEGHPEEMWKTHHGCE